MGYHEGGMAEWLKEWLGLDEDEDEGEDNG